MATPFVTDLSALFAGVQTQINSVRVSHGLLPLVTGGLLFGEEVLMQEMDAPRIVIVPTGARYEPSRRMGPAPLTGARSDDNPLVRWVRYLSFEAHCWGDPTPTPSSPPTISDLTFDFSAAIELERELLDALANNLGNTPNLRIDGSEFRQPSHDVRRGRLFVVSFRIGTPVTSEPWLILPFSTQALPGSTVQPVVNIVAVFPDGQSTSTGPFVP